MLSCIDVLSAKYPGHPQQPWEACKMIGRLVTSASARQLTHTPSPLEIKWTAEILGTDAPIEYCYWYSASPPCPNGEPQGIADVVVIMRCAFG